jgi:hypothetical protein
MPDKVEDPVKPEPVAPPIAGWAILIGNEKGGVRKTSTAIATLDHLIHRGIPVRAAQVDRQARLEAAFPDIGLVTIDLPSTDDIRYHDSADSEAFDPLHTLLLGLHDGAVAVVDIGANNVARFCGTAAATDLAHELAKLGIVVIVLIPMTSDGEAVTAGVLTAEKFQVVFPEVRIIPVLCQGGAEFDRLVSDDIQALFDTQFGPSISRGDVLTHPLLFPTALRMLERAGMSPSHFANLGVAELERVTHEVGAVARQARGEVAKYRAQFRAEINRVMPFRRD